MAPAAKLRLLLAAALFLGWIGYLGYLAATATRPVVLSRPQFLLSTFDVIAEVKDRDGKPDPIVEVREVRWPAGSKLDGTITVTNLPESVGWTGPGRYILALFKVGKHFEVVAIPRSPGYRPSEHRPEIRPEPVRIYPESPATLGQLEAIHRHKNPPL